MRQRAACVAVAHAGAALATAVVLVAGVARADAIMAPPPDCPPGSHGESSHTDTICSPTDCTTDAECTGPGTGTDAEVCTPALGLCIESRTRAMGGLLPPDMAGRMVTYDVASTSCSTPADCPAGTTCVIASRCARRTALAFARHALGCRASSGRGGALLPLLAALAVAVRGLWRRA